MNPECIICQMEKTGLKYNRCKLCGMSSGKMMRYNGFQFCCNLCINGFKNIIQKTPTHERNVILKKEVII